MRTLVVAALAVLSAAAPAAAMPRQTDVAPPELPAPAVDLPIAWRSSRAVGKPQRAAGSSAASSSRPRASTSGPTTGASATSPNRPWRRWGTDRLVRTVLAVLREYRAANPYAPRVGVADLSRRHGGCFGRSFGGLGHASHQNGLDVDILYPRLDGAERCDPGPPRWSTGALAQDLVDRFVAAGATQGLHRPAAAPPRPARVVVPLVHHDDHMHVRIR